MNHRKQGRRLMWLVWSTIPAMVGCGEVEPLDTRTGQRLRALTIAYLDYAAARGAGPANEQQLTRHLQAMPAFALGLSDVSAESLNQIFFSPRDEMPFAVKYGQPISLGGGGTPSVIAYEAVGDKGTRYVAYANGKVECVDSSAITTAVFSSTKGF